MSEPIEIPVGTFHSDAARCRSCDIVYAVNDDTESHEVCPWCIDGLPRDSRTIHPMDDVKATEEYASEFDDAGALVCVDYQGCQGGPYADSECGRRLKITERRMVWDEKHEYEMCFCIPCHNAVTSITCIRCKETQPSWRFKKGHRKCVPCWREFNGWPP